MCAGLDQHNRTIWELLAQAHIKPHYCKINGDRDLFAMVSYWYILFASRMARVPVPVLSGL